MINNKNIKKQIMILSKLHKITKRTTYDFDRLHNDMIRLKKHLKKNISKNLYEKYENQLKINENEINFGNGECLQYIYMDCISIINEIIIQLKN